VGDVVNSPAAVSAPSTKAKRGDLVAIVQEHRDYIIGQGATKHTTCQIAVVSSITREGLVKAVRWAYNHGEKWDDPTPLAHLGRIETHLVPAAKIDVAAALEAAKAHSWPSGSTMPYASLDEVRDALRPHLFAPATAKAGG
jgi:hypothetical protein